MGVTGLCFPRRIGVFLSWNGNLTLRTANEGFRQNPNDPKNTSNTFIFIKDTDHFSIVVCKNTRGVDSFSELERKCSVFMNLTSINI